MKISGDVTETKDLLKVQGMPGLQMQPFLFLSIPFNTDGFENDFHLVLSEQ